jgi:hypothetical protein
MYSNAVWAVPVQWDANEQRRSCVSGWVKRDSFGIGITTSPNLEGGMLMAVRREQHRELGTGSRLPVPG